MTSFLEKHHYSSKMIIFACRGFSMSGKDTIGEILCREYGFTRFAFADSLKELVAGKYNCDVSFLHTQEGKMTYSTVHGRTWRDIILYEGYEQRRLNENIFADMCIQKIKESGKKRIVITDLRYPNELERIICSFPGEFIKVIHVIRKGQLTSPVEDTSENLLADRIGDTILVNPGTTTDELKENIDKLIIGIDKEYNTYINNTI